MSGKGEYISPYLRQPRRSLREVLRRQAGHASDGAGNHGREPTSRSASDRPRQPDQRARPTAGEPTGDRDE